MQYIYKTFFDVFLEALDKAMFFKGLIWFVGEITSPNMWHNTLFVSCQYYDLIHTMILLSEGFLCHHAQLFGVCLCLVLCCVVL